MSGPGYNEPPTPKRVVASTLDKRRIAVLDLRNGTIHFWRKCERQRMLYSWGTDMEPLISVATHTYVSAGALMDCNCGRIRDSEGFYHCVGSYGGCERFNNREGRV